MTDSESDGDEAALSTLLKGPTPGELALPPGVAVSPTALAHLASSPNVRAQLGALYADEGWLARVLGETEEALVARYAAGGQATLAVRAFELRTVERLYDGLRRDTAARQTQLAPVPPGGRTRLAPPPLQRARRWRRGAGGHAVQWPPVSAGQRARSS